MSRTLGSFNNRLKLQSHRDDWQRRDQDPSAQRLKATAGYGLGLFMNRQEQDTRTPTGAEKFATPFRTEKKPGMRMAGSALAEEMKQSTGLPETVRLPTIGSAEIRNLNPIY